MLMGRRAMEMKWKSLAGGGDNGPESKEKRRSLKMAREPRKKAGGGTEMDGVEVQGEHY